MQTQSLPFETYRVHFKNSFCPCVKLFVVSVKLVVVVVNPTSRSVPECPHVVKQVNVLSQYSSRFVKHPTCILLLLIFSWSLPSLYFTFPPSLPPQCERYLQCFDNPLCSDDVWPVGEGASSLPFAVQHGPPVVRPGKESSLGGANRKVLVVAGGEQDVLPRRFGLHAWSRETCQAQNITWVTHYVRVHKPLSRLRLTVRALLSLKGANEADWRSSMQNNYTHTTLHKQDYAILFLSHTFLLFFLHFEGCFHACWTLFHINTILANISIILRQTDHDEQQYFSSHLGICTNEFLFIKVMKS